MDEISKEFNINKFESANNSILFLYDSLSVIDESLELIKEKGSHEFNSVIAIQLRLIFTDSNSVDGNNSSSFSLFDLMENFKLSDISYPLNEFSFFPKLDVENLRLINKKYPHYWVNEKAFYEYGTLNVDCFLSQDIAIIEDKDNKEVTK